MKFFIPSVEIRNDEDFLKNKEKILQKAIDHMEGGADEVMIWSHGTPIKNTEETDMFLKKLSEKLYIPYIVGLAFGKPEDNEKILSLGAASVILGKEIFTNGGLIDAISNRLLPTRTGGLIVFIDIIKHNNSWLLFDPVHKRKMTISAIDYIQTLNHRNVSAVVIHSVLRDIKRDGYDVEFFTELNKFPVIPNFAYGDVSDLEHIFDILIIGGAAGVMGQVIFKNRKFPSLQSIKQVLHNRGVPVSLQRHFTAL